MLVNQSYCIYLVQLDVLLLCLRAWWAEVKTSRSRVREMGPRDGDGGVCHVTGVTACVPVFLCDTLVTAVSRFGRDATGITPREQPLQDAPQ